MYDGAATLQDVAVLFNEAGEVLTGYSDYSGQGPSAGGGIATSGEGIATLERGWLLWNEAPVDAQCSGNVTARGWVVSGDPTILNTGSPCD